MPKTLLAVDDSTTMRRVLEITFSGEDFQVLTAANRNDAMGHVGGNPNAVVIDTVLEGDDGYGRDPDRPGNATVYGNLFLSHYNSCAGGGTVSVSYDHNVFAPGGGGCGAGAKLCTPRLANGQLYTNVDRQADYHLAPNDTCALGAGKAGAHPAQDLDGEARPRGAVDAGADER